MIEVAVLGFGSVCSVMLDYIRLNMEGIAKKTGEPLRVKKIYELGKIPESSYKQLITTNFHEIIQDSQIKLVIEAIGETESAYELTKLSISAGKHVVTFNEELVAAHGSELTRLADAHGVQYRYEACSGLGVPVLQSLSQFIPGNDIHSISGILGSSTNSVLTIMHQQSLDYNSAFKEFQRKNDTAGKTKEFLCSEVYAVSQKLAIFSSLVFHTWIDYHQISVMGISSIAQVDIESAKTLGYTIKQIAKCVRNNNHLSAFVCPAMIPLNNPLSRVDGACNAIMLGSRATGDMFFYGQGSGIIQTVSAIVSDVVDIIMNPDSKKWNGWALAENQTQVCQFQDKTQFFIRVKCDDSYEHTERLIERLFSQPLFPNLGIANNRNELSFFTGYESEKVLLENMKNLEKALNLLDVEIGTDDVNGILSVIRVI